MFSFLTAPFNSWFVANQYLANQENPTPATVEFAVKAVINSENINTSIHGLLQVPPNTDFTVTCVDKNGRTGSGYLVNNWNSTSGVRQVVQVNGFAFFEQPDAETWLDWRTNVLDTLVH